MFGMIKIAIREIDAEHICVNDVTLETRHILAMFPGSPDAEKALAKYLAIVPFLHQMADHFREHHKLSESAAYGVDMAPALIEAIGITEDNMIPFMLVCFEQAGESPESMAAKCRDAFGVCGEHHARPELLREGNVIQFPKRPTVH